MYGASDFCSSGNQRVARWLSILQTPGPPVRRSDSTFLDALPTPAGWQALYLVILYDGDGFFGAVLCSSSHRLSMLETSLKMLVFLFLGDHP